MALNQKRTPIPVVPRTMAIVNSDGTPTRSGQLLLEQLQKTMVSYGAAGDLANAKDVQDGSIFVVQGDNDEVLYQYQSGDWHYIAGTMWGTLSPDQRPVGLGPNDAGFTFRSIDSNTDFAPREFIWSGTVWVETTLVTYGIHAARPPANPLMPARTIYVETDRSGVIYQQQANAWHFLAGTMWGTISPDQRPTDLGANDAGFNYRATDQVREFIWSGTIWVEIAQSQTPWTSNIDGAGHSLTNASAIGVGTATPSTILSLGASFAPIKLSVYDGGTTNCYGLGIDVSGYLAFGAGISPTSGTPQMVLDHLGRVGIGLTNPGYFLQLASDSAAKPTTNTWTIASDIRLKKNIEPLEGGLEVINRLEPIVAEYNGKAGTPRGGRVVSLDPVKLREILPDAVSSIPGKLDSEETEILGVNTHEILYHLVLAVQQLAKKTA